MYFRYYRLTIKFASAIMQIYLEQNMYIQKKLKQLETQRNNLKYEIADIESEEYNEKVKLHADINAYEESLIKESEVKQLLTEIKEKEKKISLIEKMIRQKREEFREQLEEERKPIFAGYKQQIAEKMEKINSLQFNLKVKLGKLVEEIADLTGVTYTPKLTHLKGNICNACREMELEEVVKMLFKGEYDLSFIVQIGPYSFPATVKIDDETFNGKRISDCLEKVRLFKSLKIGSRLKFKENDIKHVFVNIDEKLFKEICREERFSKKHVLSQSISNIVEKEETYYQ